MAVCMAMPAPQGCSDRRWDGLGRLWRLGRKGSGRNCQSGHGLIVLQKENLRKIPHALGDSSTGVRHRRGLLLQIQGGGTHRRHRLGRR